MISDESLMPPEDLHFEPTCNCEDPEVISSTGCPSCWTCGKCGRFGGYRNIWIEDIRTKV